MDTLVALVLATAWVYAVIFIPRLIKLANRKTRTKRSDKKSIKFKLDYEDIKK